MYTLAVRLYRSVWPGRSLALTGRDAYLSPSDSEIHSRINATFAPRPVRCTYHVARSELCLLHKPHLINIPSRPRSSNGLILAILPNGKHAPRPLRARFRSTVPSLAGVARSWRAPCSRLAWADSSAELGMSNSGAAKTFAQGACSQAISTPDARMDDGVATALGRRCCLVRTRQSCPTTASSRAE